MRYTQTQFNKFDELTRRVSLPNTPTRTHDRNIARLELRELVDHIGKDVCDEIWAAIVERDGLTEATS